MLGTIEFVKSFIFNSELTGIDTTHFTFIPLSIWLIYNFYKVLFRNNSPTFKPDAQVSPEERRNNLKYRLRTLCLYGPFVPSAAIWQPTILALFLTLMIWLGLREFIAIVAPFRAGQKRPKKADDYRPRIADRTLQILGTSLALSAILFDGHYFSTVMIACLYGIFVIHLLTVQFRFEELNLALLHALALHITGFLIVAYTWSHGILIARAGRPYCGGMGAMMLLSSWTSDGAGYFIGKKVGTRKAFPDISPGKTVAGTIACIVFAILPCLMMRESVRRGILPDYILPPNASIWMYIGYGLIIGIAGVFGGLICSLIKRSGGVKDSGVFFTGHGGVFDRFDTFILCSPATYVFAVLLNEYTMASVE